MMIIASGIWLENKLLSPHPRFNCQDRCVFFLNACHTFYFYHFFSLLIRHQPNKPIYLHVLIVRCLKLAVYNTVTLGFNDHGVVLILGYNEQIKAEISFQIDTVTTQRTLMVLMNNKTVTRNKWYFSKACFWLLMSLNVC